MEARNNDVVVDRQNYKRYPVGNQVNMELDKLNSYENLRYSGREYKSSNPAFNTDLKLPE